MKQKIPLADAEAQAKRIVELLRPFCQRVEIAGSIRRRKPEVGDIEIVAIPHQALDMFGTPKTNEHELNSMAWSMLGRVIKDGNKYKQVELKEGINLDLFIVTPPAQWGVQFLIRTGPAEYSHKFVTRRQSGGMLPSNLKVKDGAIWHGLQKVETPEERDVYKVLGIPWCPPEERNV